MWLIFFYASAIVLFAGIIYMVMRFIHAAEKGSGYPGLEDVTSWEYEKI
jgi:hypothetical protein